MSFEETHENRGHRSAHHDENAVAELFTCPSAAIETPLPVFADTWYVKGIDEIGIMALGDGPRREQARMAEFINAQGTRFQTAFSPLARMRVIQLYHVSSPSSVHVTGTRIPVTGDVSAWQQSVRASLVETSLIVTHIFVQLDFKVTLRTAKHELEDRWLPLTGNLMLWSDWDRKAADDDPTIEDAAWNAKLDCEVASLFRRDNSVILRQVREAWRSLRITNPTATELPGSEGGIVTLVSPPPDTPDDNMALYSVNAPRLREAIARWERFTGQTFRWDSSMK